MPVVNFGAIQERISLFPDGQYEAHFTGWKLVERPNKDPYYNMEYTLAGGEFDGQKVWKINSLGDTSLWAFKNDMLALQANPSDLAPDSTVDTDDIVAGCVGAECRLDLEAENYTKNDRTPGRRSRVAAVLSPLPF